MTHARIEIGYFEADREGLHRVYEDLGIPGKPCDSTFSRMDGGHPVHVPVRAHANGNDSRYFLAISKCADRFHVAMFTDEPQYAERVAEVLRTRLTERQRC
jgi:hypothetical protein